MVRHLGKIVGCQEKPYVDPHPVDEEADPQGERPEDFVVQSDFGGWWAVKVCRLVSGVDFGCS